MFSLPGGTRICVAAGVTDMRKGPQGLTVKVEAALQDGAILYDAFENVADAQ
jgi:transposase